MLLPTKDRLTGLPLVQEGRAEAFVFRALPRPVRSYLLDGKATWTLDWQQWDGAMQTAVRCWKCGTPIKGWRPLIDRWHNLVTVGGQPAVHFTLLSNFRHSLMQAQLPKLGRRVSLTVLHCADCEIRPEHGLELLTCYLCGVDAGLRHAWGFGSAKGISADQWASYLLRWSGAEPDTILGGPMEDPAHDVDRLLLELRQKGYDRLPVPGEILTTARYLMDLDQARFAAMPTGAVVGFEGAEVPPGWERVPNQKQIRKL